MKHTRKKSNGRKRHMLLLPVLLVAMVALILGATAPQVWADDAECWFNIEFNASDLDVGVRGFFDWEPWKELKIEDPDGKMIDKDKVKKSMKEQGKAEFFFESGEPELDGEDYTFEIFFERFPEEDYVFEAKGIEGDKDDCVEELTHVIPCAPVISAAGNTTDGVVISWGDVTQVVDTETTDDNIADPTVPEDEKLVCVPPDPEEEFEIVGYEVIVETEVGGEEKIYEIDLPATANSVTVPPEFIALGTEFQYEVLAIEDSGNQTITEEEFCIATGTVVEGECP